MAFIYTSILTTTQEWSSPASGPTGGTAPITIAEGAGIITSSGNALDLFDGPYVVTNNGTLTSDNLVGLQLWSTLSAGLVSKISNSATGSISGDPEGLRTSHAISLKNAGFIGGGTGIYIEESATLNSITNVAGGMILGYVDTLGKGELNDPNETFGFIAIHAQSAIATKISNQGTFGGSVYSTEGAVALDNSGQLQGHVYVTDGMADTVKNAGTIIGHVYLFDGNDKFTNSGVTKGQIRMGAGDDLFTGGKSAESVFDEAGKDSYKLGDGLDTFYGFASGSDSKDVLNNIQVDIVDGGAHAGTNIAMGFYGDIYDAKGATLGVLINLDGKDFLNATKLQASGGGLGIDIIKGFESAHGGGGDDLIVGNAAANDLWGQNGHDKLYGGAGNDRLLGWAGNDLLAGGTGSDNLNGGTGSDTFYYAAISDSTLDVGGKDLIGDFTDGDDVISFSGLGLTSYSTVIVGGAFTAAAGTAEVRVLNVFRGWQVQLDSDGDGKADLSIDVQDVSHVLSWDSTDISFVV